MLIETNDTAKKKFHCLNDGEAFVYANTYYIKIEECRDTNDITCNAVDLDDGTLISLEQDDWVEPVDARIVIR